MTLEEKLQEVTRQVKQKLDDVNYRITDIMSFVVSDKLHRDSTRKNAIITSFTEATLYRDVSIVSDPETLEMRV